MEHLDRCYRRQTLLCMTILLLLSGNSVARNVRNTVNGQPDPPWSFTIDNDRFYKDGVEFRIMAGSLHYFRVHPEYWEDRLLRAKALGLNAIQTYIPWNLHQPQPDRLNFEANTFADIEGFLKAAQKLDMLVMLRPGPYICGEWDFGGFPAWLLAVEPALSLRTSDTEYLKLVDKWWNILLPKVTPFLYSEGGPVIMVQIENEYGSFGTDKVYMKHLIDTARAHLGENVILYTTDGAVYENLSGGSINSDDVYAAVDFPVEWDAAAAFRLQKLFNAPGKSPPLASEFYTGWLTHWGEPLAHTDPHYLATALDRLLGLNASVVLYMVHGGTNFAFSSGSNTGSTANEYFPDITSYDYDAPISESGSCESAKYKVLREVFSNHSSHSVPYPPPLSPRKDYGIVGLHKLSSLFHVLDSVSIPPHGIPMDQPRGMEMLGQVSGFILYRSTLPAHTKFGSKLRISEIRDRAQIFVVTSSNSTAPDVEHKLIGTLERWSTTLLELPSDAAVPGSQLDILVENMGRVNYGPFIFDPKGISNGVFLDDVPILGWTAYPIPLDSIQDISSRPVYLQQHVEQKPTLREIRELKGADHLGASCYVFPESSIFSSSVGWLDVDVPADTFVSLRGWSKGVLFINGFNLGRFWPAKGPQCTLYVPAPLLHIGVNELILFELENPSEKKTVAFVRDADFTCGLSLVESGDRRLASRGE